MAYVKIDNNKKAILKHNDNRPARLYVNGELMTDISYIDKTTEQDTYTSEYKANLTGLELQGNTEQNSNASPTTPQTIKNSGDYSSIDYTSQMMDLIKSGEYSQAGVSGVALVNVPSELVDKNITYNLSASLPSGYSIGLLKGSNFLFGDSVDITTIPITKSGFDSIYINGIASYEEIPALFNNVTLYAIEEQEGVKGIDVKLSGVNLLDNSGRIYAQYSTFESTETGFEIISNVTNNVPLCFLRNIEAEEGKRYFIDFDCAFFNSVPTSARPNELHIRASNNVGSSSSGDKLVTYVSLGTKEQLAHKQFAFTMPSGYKYIKLWFYGSVIKATFVDYKAVFTNFIVSKDEAKPYQPYFAPVTVNIPSEVTLTDGTVVPLRFAKYRNADYLSMNNKQVKYFQYSTEGDSTKPLNEQVENVPPIEYDLTDTEVGQQLLALAEATQNQTNIITATSEIPLSKKIITYAKWGGNSED